METNKCDKVFETPNKETPQEIPKLVKADFETGLNQLINEIDLVFDYITKDTKTKLKKYCNKVINNNEYRNKQMNIIVDILKPYEMNILKITHTQKKIKTTEFDFLNNICLFENYLDFSVFKNENKNTKISLVNYLSKMYMASSFSKWIEGDFSIDQIKKELDDFVQKIKESQNTQSTQNTQRPRKQKNTRNNGIENIMESLMSNKSIMDMSTEIAKDFERKKIDPMNLVSSLLTGKRDNKLNSIINDITKKLDEKMTSGELNKNELEDQANNVLKSMEEHIPMMSSLKHLIKKPK